MSVRFLAPFAMLACVGTSVAREPQDVALALDVDAGAVIEVSSRGAGLTGLSGQKLDPPSPWVRSVARLFTGGKYDWAIGETAAAITNDSTDVPIDPVEPGQVNIAFRAVGDSDHRMLLVANGYDKVLVYTAEVSVNGALQHTDVCTVMPGKFGIEHWPYAIDRIVLFRFRLEKMRKGQAPRCE